MPSPSSQSPLINKDQLQNPHSQTNSLLHKQRNKKKMAITWSAIFFLFATSSMTIARTISTRTHRRFKSCFRILCILCIINLTLELRLASFVFSHKLILLIYLFNSILPETHFFYYKTLVHPLIA